MVEWSLANLAAWSVQAAAVVVAGAWLPTRLRLGVPRARLLLFRLLLVGCVALPLAQPWHAAPAAPAAQAAIDVPAPSLDSNASPAGPVAPAAAARPPPSRSLRESASGRRPCRGRWWSWPFWPSASSCGWRGWRWGSCRWRGCGARPRPSIRRWMPSKRPCGRSVCRAAFLASPRVPRPVTFGLLRPVVIVPPGFTSLDPRQQRAVACHELLHVKRQDWLRTFGDELVRGLLWFHPAIWWLVEQIHLTAEQTIDREVVALVGDRRSYLRALLALAESGAGPRLQPAACFLDHGHLRQRVAMLMEEASMSRVRLVASVVLVLAVLAAGGWWSVNAFPLRGAPEPSFGVCAARRRAAWRRGAGVAARDQPAAAAGASRGPAAPPAPPAPPQKVTRPGMATAPTGAALDEAYAQAQHPAEPEGPGELLRARHGSTRRRATSRRRRRRWRRRSRPSPSDAAGLPGGGRLLQPPGRLREDDGRAEAAGWRRSAEPGSALHDRLLLLGEGVPRPGSATPRSGRTSTSAWPRSTARSR